MRNSKIVIALILFLFPSTILCSAFGQDVLVDKISKDKIDFYDAINFALENNNNIRAMKKGLSATERDIGIARSNMLPKLRFNENFVATNNPTDALSYRLNQARATANDLTVVTLNHPDSVTNFLTAGILEQRILDRKALIEIKMAKKEYSANGYFFLRKQEELVNSVSQAYLNVSTNQEYVKVAEQAINDAKKHLKFAESQNKNIKEFETDILRAKSAIAFREEKLNEAQKNLNISKRNLGLQLGLENSIEVTSSIPDIQLQDINYYKQIAVYRNDIKAMQVRVENAKNNIKAAQADWYPTFTAAASYNFYNSNYPFGGSGNNYTVGAFFKWEALDGNKRKYEILKAKDKEVEAREYLEWLRKTVDFKVYETYLNVEEHQKNLKLTNDALKHAEEDTKLVEKRWQTSELPFVALVDAQTNLNQARENLVKNRFELQEDLIYLIYESGIIAQVFWLK